MSPASRTPTPTVFAVKQAEEWTVSEAVVALPATMVAGVSLSWVTVGVVAAWAPVTAGRPSRPAPPMASAPVTAKAALRPRREGRAWRGARRRAGFCMAVSSVTPAR
ncbi:hypothetical protein ACFQ0M_36565 [Kitasatospora aburaviensis]